MTYRVPENFTGYEPIIKMFGSSLNVSDYEVFEFDQEITGAKKFRSDGKTFRRAEWWKNEDERAAFFGPILKDVPDDQEEMHRYDNSKLIGFHTISGPSNEQPLLWVIKSIAPIFDTSNCELSDPNKDPASYELKVSQDKNTGETTSTNTNLNL